MSEQELDKFGEDAWRVWSALAEAIEKARRERLQKLLKEAAPKV